MKILFVWPNKDSFGYKPIGLSILSALAKEKGWKTKLFDATPYDFGYADNTSVGESVKIFKPVDMSAFGHLKHAAQYDEMVHDFEVILKEYNPDCVCFSVLSDEFVIAGTLSDAAKKFNADISVVWGGKLPTVAPQRTLEKFTVDYVCVGEGLEALPELLDAIAAGSVPTDMQNIWLKKNNTIIPNPLRPLKKELDDLPFLDWEIFPEAHFYKPFDGKAYKSGDHMLNWGCVNYCSYCINHFYHILYDNRYFTRRYSIQRIISELKWLKDKYSLEFFKFHDEDFLMRPLKNFRELSQQYAKHIGLPFVIETNPMIMTKERAQLLKDMNCVSVSLAIETGDPHLRKNVLNRRDSLNDVVNSFKYVNDVNIRTSCFLMLAIPFETSKTYETTINLVRKANVQYPNGGFFYPFEGTKLREVSIEHGFYDPDDPDSKMYRRDEPALKFSELTSDNLKEKRAVLPLRAKLPLEYTKFIKRSEELDDVGIKLRKKLNMIYEETVWKNDNWYISDGKQHSYLAELESIVIGG